MCLYFNSHTNVLVVLQFLCFPIQIISHLLHFISVPFQLARQIRNNLFQIVYFSLNTLLKVERLNRQTTLFSAASGVLVPESRLA